jgi:RNA polymerase sigma-70 factor (ECF subfamily)
MTPAKAATLHAQSSAAELPDPMPPSGLDAFERFVAAHDGPIRRLVFRLLAWRDGGEDVVQEVFLSAWAGWSRFRGQSSAEFWLKRIAVNKCRSRVRREAVRTRWLRWVRRAPPEEPHAIADDRLAGDERACRVRRAIGSLAPPYREATVLHYLEEMSVDEIAKMLHTRRNTIEVRLHRARKRLAELLADLAE